MSDQLVEIARFGTANEAAVARSALEAAGIPAVLDGNVTATWLWHLGGALGGVKLLVREEDAEDARSILSPSDVDEEHQAAADADAQDEGEDEQDAAPILPPATRAWRAAVMGLFLLPPLLNIYSMSLLIRHGLIFGEKLRAPGWQARAALLVNVLVLSAVALFVYVIVAQSLRAEPAVAPPGRPAELRYHVTIPLVPYDAAPQRQGFENRKQGQWQESPRSSGDSDH